MYYKALVSTPILSSLIKIWAKHEYRKKLPDILEWINETTVYYKQNAQFISELNIPRLSDYYSQELLQKTQVAVVNRCPIPPFRKMGIKSLSAYEDWNPNGIQYKDMYFVRKDLQDWNVVHFHELVHTLQWKHLKEDAYIDLYGTGIIEKGYRNSPLEEMAWRLQKQFECDSSPFDVNHKVETELKSYTVIR